MSVEDETNHEKLPRRSGSPAATARPYDVAAEFPAGLSPGCMVIDAKPVDVVVVDGDTGAVLDAPTLHTAMRVATRDIVAWHLHVGDGTPVAFGRLALTMPAASDRFANDDEHRFRGRPETVVPSDALSVGGGSFLERMSELGIDVVYPQVRTPR